MDQSRSAAEKARLARKFVVGVATDFDNRDRTENIAVESIV